MKVLIVSISTLGGGAEKSSMSLHREFLKSNDIDSCYLSVYNLGEEEFQNENQKNQFLLNHNNHSLFSKVIATIKFSSFLNREEFDFIILNCEFPEFVYAFCGRIVRSCIVVEHASIPWKDRRALGFIVRGILKLKKVTWVTVNSQQTNIWWTLEEPIFIPNPVVFDSKLRDDQASTSVSLEKLCFVGRLVKDKQPDWVVRCAIELEVSCEIFGTGPLLHQLKNASKQSGHQIKFHGFVSEPFCKVSPETLVVIPSLHEGDGLVVVEAIAHGCSILLHDNPDLRRFQLDDHYYFSDYEELKAKIIEAKNFGINQFKLGEEVTARILGPRMLPNVVNKWRDLLRNELST